MTRNILNHNGDIIGELTLPDETSEEEWTFQLSRYASAPASPTIDEIISNKVDAAIAFGEALSEAFVKENVKLGITQLGLTNHVRKTLREVKDALETGSVYDAITEIKILDPASLDAHILTPARMLVFRNKIEIFLNVPLATSWDDPETWL